MKSSLLYFLIALLWSLTLQAQDFVKFNPDLPENTLVRIKIKDLHPTQAVVGKIEVKARMEKLKKLGKNKLNEMLEGADKIAPIVVGPGGKAYIVDHHHLAYGLQKENISKHMYGKITANWSHLSEAEFEKKMIEHKWTYLGDQDGKPISFRQLPEHIDELKDDPYRSLAWGIEERGGTTQTDPPTPFKEFADANYLRDKVKKKTINNNFDKATDKAMKFYEGANPSCNVHYLAVK